MSENIEKEIVWAGAMCSREANKCKLWFVSTINNKTHEVEIDAPIDIKTAQEERQLEIKLEDLFRNSRAKVSIPHNDP
mgnify:CR=1 FL=1